MVTDQPERQIASEIIREKALRLLDEEVPHGIYVEVSKYSLRKTTNNKALFKLIEAQKSLVYFTILLHTCQ